MDLLPSIVHHFIVSILICTFYQRAIKRKTLLFYILGMSVLFSIYMVSTNIQIVEPFRMFLGATMLGGFLWLTHKEINGAALILALAFGYAEWILWALVTAIVNASLQIDPYAFASNITSIIVETIILLVLYRFPKLKNGVPYIKDAEIKGIIYCVIAIIFSICGVIQLNINTTYEHRRLLSFTLAALALLVITGLFLSTLYLRKKHREKLSLEKERTQERATFKQTIALLEKQCQENLLLYTDERAANHKYKDLIPTMTAACNEALADLQGIKDRNKIISLKDITHRLNEVGAFSAELAEEFMADSISSMIKSLQIPATHTALGIYLKGKAKDCESKNIVFSCKNSASDKAWERTGNSKHFVFLVTNLLSNAIKELDKSNVKGKQIRIEFTDIYGMFVLEINDNAHEFPAEVYSKLGERGNSTNGTGDGYAEVFEFLRANKASLVIQENKYSGECFKSISVVFDGKERVVIRTNYRYDELCKHLKSTQMVIESVSPTLSKSQRQLKNA